MNSSQPMIDIPATLVERIRDDACALFVGPQASLAQVGFLGPPGPATLVAQLAAQLQHVPLVPGDLMLPRISVIYKKEHGEEPLLSFLNQQLHDERYRPTLLHQWIAALPVTHIISTAYDTLLDDLLLVQHPDRVQVLDATQLGGFNRRQLIKLFGSADKEQSLLITDVQLERIFEARGMGTIGSFLYGIAGSMTLLFVGYYLDDEIFRKLFLELRWQQHDNGEAGSSGRSTSMPRTAFAVQSPDQPAISWGTQLHLNVIRAHPAQFLAALATKVAQAREDPQPETPQPQMPHELPDEVRQARIAARTSVLNRWGGVVVQADNPQAEMSSQAFHFLRFIHELQAEEPAKSDSRGDDQLAALEARVKLAYGSAEWAEGNYKVARQHLEEAVALDPDLLEAHVSLHYLLTELREYDLALKSYERVLELDETRTALPSSYELREVMGASNLGIVYKAHGKREKRLVSVTVLRRALQEDLDALNRFVSNSRKVNHSQVASLLHLGEHRGRFYIVQEIVDGIILARWMEHHSLDEDTALTLIDRVAEALKHAHSLKLPHLSLNPHNILVSDDHRLSLINFREMELLAGRLPPEAIRDRDYLAPEQRAGNLGDERSDIYALGAIARDLLKSGSEDEAYEVFFATARQTDPKRRFKDADRMRQELRRVANASQPEGTFWVFQPLYRLLSLLTGIWKSFENRDIRYRVVALGLFLLILIPAFGGVPLPQLRFASRFVLLLALYSITAGWITQWRMGVVARQYGYASLIRSGPGIGMLFGILTTFWHIRNLVRATVTSEDVMTSITSATNVLDCAGAPVPVSLNVLTTTPEFLSFVLTSAILNLGLTLILLVTAHAVGRSSEARWNHYLEGLYGVFLVWCSVVLLFTVVLAPPLQCLITVYPS